MKGEPTEWEERFSNDMTDNGLCVCGCVCVCVLAAQLYLTPCDPIDCSLPRSSVLGILQARVLEWVAIRFCRGSS